MQSKVGEDAQPARRHDMAARNLSCFLCTLVAAGLYWTSLTSLAAFAAHDDIYLYSGVLPLVSAILIYRERKRIFSHVRYSLVNGLALILLALAIRWGNRMYSAPTVALSLAILSFIVLWLGIFVLCYGTGTLRAAGFQLSLLFLMVPLPAVLMEEAVFVMRYCSTQTAGVLFRLLGLPVFQNGFRFSLPGLDVEVAEQCSGIRSGLSFFITSLLAGHLFLRSPWGRLGLFLAAFPITVFKNGLRIVTIYLLSLHPNMESITLLVHHYGGIPFSFLGLAFLAAFVSFLRRLERTAQVAGRVAGGSGIVPNSPATPTLDLRCL